MKKNIFGDDVKRVHFIGIGGISMSGLAEMLMARGFAVSGSDDNVSDATERLGSLGIKIYTAHEAANLNDCPDLVVYTAAIKNGNSELAAARSKNIRVIDRAELLGLMINENDSSVCIAGCHGKTTTTSIVADICVGAGYDPSVNVGGYMQSSGKNFRAGSTGCMIAEACEYSDSFLKFYPRIGVILNIEEDHMDYFKTKKNLYASYRKFAENIKPGGALIIYGGIPGIEEVTLGLGCRVITYGTENANYMARNISRAECGSTEFDIFFNGVFFVHAKLRLRGGHNILNALAAAAAVRELGAEPEIISCGIASALGVKRRYEIKGSFNGVTVVDDYAHHPTAIEATLAETAINKKSRRIICVFQPHTYTRTENLLDEFACAFSNADIVVLIPIYASREAFTEKISSKILADKIKENKNGGEVFHAENFDEAEKLLEKLALPGDVLVTMGAGDVYLIGERLIEKGFKC